MGSVISHGGIAAVAPLGGSGRAQAKQTASQRGGRRHYVRRGCQQRESMVSVATAPRRVISDQVGQGADGRLTVRPFAACLHAQPHDMR